jgi:hypothetical protein
METKKEREERLEEAREEKREEEREEIKEAIAAEKAAVAAMSAPKPEEPKPEKVVSSNEKRKAKILEDLEKCLKEYGGETNVPYTHNYWILLKEFRSLQ